MQNTYARIAAASASITVLTVAIAAQSRAPEASGDWPMYSHSLSGQRYSPLAEITATNVERLASRRGRCGSLTQQLAAVAVGRRRHRRPRGHLQQRLGDLPVAEARHLAPIPMPRFRRVTRR